jgi:translation initiation factor 2B subunit (eIF-2B alpha/beta/delta family)
MFMLHPAIVDLVEQFGTGKLHAARSGRVLIGALCDVVRSRVDNIDALINDIEKSIDAILEVLPAYAPPLNIMHIMMSHIEETRKYNEDISQLRERILREENDYLEWAKDARTKIHRYGAELIPEEGKVFTFTLSETTTGVFQKAFSDGKKFQLYVTESRPNNDGLITAEVLGKLGIPVFVGIDACLSQLVATTDIMIVGGEAIMADGSAICKVGTYPSALVANEVGIPVYVVVDTMKFNVTSTLGIPLRMKPVVYGDIFSEELSNVGVTGYRYDSTPANLITGIVTERGVINPHSCTLVMQGMKLDEKLGLKLSVWANK